MACEKQGNAPCATCPFRKDSQKGYLGGATIPTFVGQLAGPFFIPCHSAEGYDPRTSRDPSKHPQCVGAAALRENASKKWVWGDSFYRAEPGQLDKVFADYAEFASHHVNMPKETLEMVFTEMNVRRLTQHEMAKACIGGGTVSKA